MDSHRHKCITVLLILLGIVCILATSTASYGVIIEQAILDSVVQIITSTNETGTGFLMEGTFDETKDQKTAFLVTNKHMLGCWNPVNGKLVSINDWITVRFYRKKPESLGPVLDIRVQLKHPDGSLDTSQVALHPDSSVDVVVVKLEQSISKTKGFEGIIPLSILSWGYFKSFDSLPDGFTDIGSLVFALGYPRGITSVLTNRPVAKAGYLAAVPGQELALNTKWKTCDGKEGSVIVRGKLFLIDGLIVPGNSGGPVLLPAGELFGQDLTSGKFQIRMTQKNRIIGIVSSGLGPSGLTYAYSSDYIDELIKSLLKTTSSKPVN